MKRAKSKRDAYKKAALFISLLPTQPVRWEVSGSWTNGTAKPGKSDIDISAWFEGADEAILMAFYAASCPTIDFHWYCREWGVYQVDPELWNRQIWNCNLLGCEKKNQRKEKEDEEMQR